MSCTWLCWAAPVLLLAALGATMGVMLFPKSRKAKELRRDLADEVEAWRHPETQHPAHTAPARSGPND